MKLRTFVAGVLFLPAVASAQASGSLESPAAGEVATGIGVINGWHCTATAITIQVDDQAPLPAGTRTERPDTRTVCGRTDTGFSLLVNFNAFTPGTRTIIARADGVEFARRTFTAANLGVEFLAGKRGRRVLRNFPDLNQAVVAEWQEGRQDFVVVARGNGTTNAVSPLAGVYYGAAGTQCVTDATPTMQDERFARFEVSVSSDNRTLGVQVRYADGFTCTMSGTMSADEEGFFVASPANSTCQLGTANLRIEADGVRVRGVLGSVPGSGCATTRAFYGVKPTAAE